MQKKIFYSWQSDLPNASNRTFILKALERAVSNIKIDGSIKIEPVIDRDTHGIAGSPDISATIFGKISKADIFLCDISIINSESDGRLTPNPNVLIELGYALHCLGFEKVILVFNLAISSLNKLPFDLITKRILTYNSPKHSDKRSEERELLVKNLEVAIRAILNSDPGEPEPIEHPSITAISSQSPSRNVVLRKSLKAMFERLLATAPPRKSEGGNVEAIIRSIEASESLVLEFLSVAEITAQMKDSQSLEEIYKWFGKIFERYNSSRDYLGISNDGDYDYFRFIGHELLTSLIAILLNETEYALIKKLLDRPIPISYLREQNGPGEAYFYYAAKWAPEINNLDLKYNKLSYHGYLLKERHTNGALAQIMPINQFAAADYFLYLYNNITSNQKDIFNHWRPWTIAYLDEPPLFLKQIERKKFAEEFASILNLESIKELQELITKHTLEARSFFRNTTLDLFLRSYKFEEIGSK